MWTLSGLTANRTLVRTVPVPSTQLPLPFSTNRRLTAADFRDAPSNQEARQWLDRTADWPDGRLALWGQAGCGKTHLLHIWAASTGATLWSGQSLRGLPHLPASPGIALDDADAAPDETALLHLLNAAAEAGMPVLLAARTPPARWPVRLPDLASRLRAITAIEIGPPEDALLQALLARLLLERQLRVLEPVQNWLLTRLPRSAGAIRDAVARLDATAMHEQRTITVRFARDVLAHEISGADEDPSPENPPLV